MKTVLLQVSPRILSELPRFFGGPKATIKELFQNAHRAGATLVRVETQPGGMVFQDNGQGLKDPEVLFHAATSGWSASVLDPAGVGVFSTLNPEWVRAVTFESAGWKVSLTPEHLSTLEPLVVLEGEVQQGMRITMELHKPLINPKYDYHPGHALRALRGFLPFTLTVGEDTFPPLGFEGMHHTETVDADVYYSLRTHHTGQPGGVSVLWEGQPLQVTFPEVTRSGEQTLSSRFHQAGQVFIVPRPNAQIRPKLPDRTGFIENLELSDFLRRVDERLHQHLLDRFAGFLGSLPETLPNTDLVPWPDELKSAAFLQQPLLEAVGFKPTHIREYHHPSSDDSFMDLVSTFGASRGAMEVDDSEVEQVWNTLHLAGAPGFEHPASFQFLGSSLHLETADSRDRDFIRLATRIEVGGVELPYHMGDCLWVHQDHMEVIFTLLDHAEREVRDAALTPILNEDDGRRYAFVSDENVFDAEGYRLDLLIRIAEKLELDERVQEYRSRQSSRVFQQALSAAHQSVRAMLEVTSNPDTRQHIGQVLGMLDRLPRP